MRIIKRWGSASGIINPIDIKRHSNNEGWPADNVRQAVPSSPQIRLGTLRTPIGRERSLASLLYIFSGHHRAWAGKGESAGRQNLNISIQTTQMRPRLRVPHATAGGGVFVGLPRPSGALSCSSKFVVSGAAIRLLSASAKSASSNTADTLHRPLLSTLRPAVPPNSILRTPHTRSSSANTTITLRRPLFSALRPHIANPNSTLHPPHARSSSTFWNLLGKMSGEPPSNPKEVRKYLQQSHDRIFESNRKWASEQKAKHPEFFEKLAQGQSPDYLWIGESGFFSFGTGAIHAGSPNCISMCRAFLAYEVGVPLEGPIGDMKGHWSIR